MAELLSAEELTELRKALVDPIGPGSWATPPVLRRLIATLDAERLRAEQAESAVERLREAALEYLAHDGSGIQRDTPPEWRGDWDAFLAHDALRKLRAALTDTGDGT